jgi:hypothetical protein
MDIESLYFLRNFSTLFLELVTAIIATLYYSKYSNSILKYFLIYLWITVMFEYLGYFLVDYFHLIKNNSWLFNLYSLLNFTYLFFLYWKVIKNKKKKQVIKYSYFTYILALIISAFFENYLIQLQTIPYIVGSSLLILAIIFYFIEILASEKVLYVRKNLLFWISVGLLLFHVGGIPFTISFNYYVDAGGFNTLFSINYVLIIILNLCYIIGFIWSSKKLLY